MLAHQAFKEGNTVPTVHSDGSIKKINGLLALYQCWRSTIFCIGQRLQHLLSWCSSVLLHKGKSQVEFQADIYVWFEKQSTNFFSCMVTQITEPQLKVQCLLPRWALLYICWCGRGRHGGQGRSPYDATMVHGFYHSSMNQIICKHVRHDEHDLQICWSFLQSLRIQYTALFFVSWWQLKRTPKDW